MEKNRHIGICSSNVCGKKSIPNLCNCYKYVYTYGLMLEENEVKTSF